MGKKRFSIILLLTLAFVMMFSTIATAEDYNKYTIYYDGAKTNYSGYYTKGNVYLPVAMIGDYFKNSGVTLDSKNNRLNIDTTKLNIKMADDEVTAFVKANAGTIYIPTKTINGMQVFSLNVMEQFYKTTYSVAGSSIKLRPFSGKETIAKVNTSGTVAVPTLYSSAKSNLTLQMGERVYITGSSGHYYKIADYDEQEYYVLKSCITTEDIDLSSVDIFAPKKTKSLTRDKFNISWVYSSGTTPEAPSSMDGLDILVPTWFRLQVEGGGNIANVGDRGFTDLAHNNGYKVWACITNDMSAKGSTNFTTKMFNTPSIQNKAVAQYILYSCLYDVDGINIDFETVKDADRDGLTAFTKQMRKYSERQGLVLSIDTLIPESWNVEYDYASLANTVDYLAVMTYDEHYSGSKTAGSVASLPWVEKAIQNTINMGVPANKILMGIPMYARAWTVDSAGNVVSNPAYTMGTVQAKLAETGATVTYLTKEKQNYVEYPSDKGTVKIWIEDKVSIANRLYLVNSYNLAGSACWQYSQADPEIWAVFAQYL